jgi:hypothetical protein
MLSHNAAVNAAERRLGFVRKGIDGDRSSSALMRKLRNRTPDALGEVAWTTHQFAHFSAACRIADTSN